MKGISLKMLLGILAVNLTVYNIKELGVFPTAHAQIDVQKNAICNMNGQACAEI